MSGVRGRFYRKARFALAGLVALIVVCAVVFYVPRLLAIRALVSRGATYRVEFSGVKTLKSCSALLGGKPLDVSRVWDRCGLWGVPFGSVHEISYYSADGTTDRDLQLLAAFPEVEYVESLNASQVTDASCQALLKCRQLKSLMLEGSQITDVGLAQLGRLRTLKTLTLSAMSSSDWETVPITGTGFAAWPSDHGLVECHAYNTGFTDDGIIALARLPKLSILNLNSCRDIEGEKWRTTPVPVFRSLNEILIDFLGDEDRFLAAQPLLKMANYRSWPRDKESAK